MDMYRPSMLGKSQNQATGSTIVIWIVFNDLTRSKSLTNLFDTYVTNYALIQCVLGKFKSVIFDFRFQECDIQFLSHA